MEDGQTKVTMTLDRFKQLESYEAVFNALSENEKFIWYKAWDDGYVVSIDCETPAKLIKELRDAVQMRDDTIRKVRDYEKRTGKKVFEYDHS